MKNKDITYLLIDLYQLLRSSSEKKAGLLEQKINSKKKKG